MNNPFSGQIAERIPLSTEPLARVLVQLVYEPIMRISTSDGLAKFQDAIRNKFPLVQAMKQVVQTGLTDEKGEDSSYNTVMGVTYQFISADSTARLTVTDKALTLETANYIGRESFLSDFQFVLKYFLTEFSPTVTRLGFRYVNRISALDDEGQLTTPMLIKKELLGLHGMFPEQLPVRELSEARLTVPEGVVNMLWGHTDPDYIHNNLILSPTDMRAWVLDVDTMTNDDKLRLDCNVDSLNELIEKIEKLADRGRTIFRWCVSSEFMDHFAKEES